MKNNELKKIMNDNRNDIAKASRLGLGIVLGAVILIGIIFYGIAPKTRKSRNTDSAAPVESRAEVTEVPEAEPETDNVQPEEVIERPQGHLYRAGTDTAVTDKSGGYIGAAAEGELFTSYDVLDINEFGQGKQIEVEYLSQRGFISADDLDEVGTAVVLPTAGSSIMKDEFNGSYPCDPEDSGYIAATALVNSQKLFKWDKTDLISAAKVLKTGDDLVALINTYSGGDLIAEKKSDISENALRSSIDEGKRVLLAVRYSDGIASFDYSDYYGITAGTQYVVVCGYENDDEDGLFFYCCDPFYGQGGRSLATIDAESLVTSAGLVDDARKGMIILR